MHRSRPRLGRDKDDGDDEDEGVRESKGKM